MGQIKLGNKIIECWIDENGERIIDGKSVDEFIKTLTFDELLKFAVIGQSEIRHKNISPKLILEILDGEENIKN